MRVLFLSFFIAAFLIFSCPVFAHEFKIFASGDQNAPTIELCQKTGISSIWFYSGLPLNLKEKGAPESARKIADIFNRFEGSNIELIPLMNIFYQKNPGKNQNVCFCSKPLRRCFSKDNSDVLERIKLFSKWLSRFKNFGGFCVDDEAGLMPGGCHCENCAELFKKKYGIDPPSKKDYIDTPKGIVPETNPVLLWVNFQREEMIKYYASIAKCVKTAKPDAKVITIPAAAYFAGKQLSIPNCKDKDFVKSRRLVSLDECHIRSFQLYVQFYMNEVSSSGWKKKMGDGLCLYMMKKGLVNFPNIPVYAKSSEKGKQETISPAAFKRFILQTFSEGGRGVVYFPGRSISPAHAVEAEDAYRNFIKPICRNVPQLCKHPGKVAVFYSTTTRAFADIWRKNPIERYRHLHECDALAYYLFRKNIPFEVILENEIETVDDLKKFHLIISAGLNYLSSEKASLLKGYINNGGSFIIDKSSSVQLGKKVGFDADNWYKMVEKGCQRASDMEYQAGILEPALSKFIDKKWAICRTSSRKLNVNYLSDGKDIYLFIVNDDLDAPVDATLHFNGRYKVFDVLKKETLNATDKLNVSLPPAQLKALRLSTE